MKKIVLITFLFAAMLAPALVFALDKPADLKNPADTRVEPSLLSDSKSSAVQANSAILSGTAPQNSGEVLKDAMLNSAIPQDIIDRIQKMPFLLMGAKYLAGGLMGAVISNSENVRQLAEGYLSESNKKGNEERDGLGAVGGSEIGKNIRENNYDGLVENLRNSLKLKLK